MVQTLMIGVSGLLTVFLAFVATRPNNFRIQRTTTIYAAPETIFPFLNDVHQALLWSPWEKKDPDMRRTFSGPQSGRGAAYAWEGNREVGKGSLEIVDSTSPTRVVQTLHFFKPFEASNTVEYTLEAYGDTTTVTWTMYGPQPFLAKLMGVVLNCEKMIGKDFEAGLASLKALAET